MLRYLIALAVVAVWAAVLSAQATQPATGESEPAKVTVVSVSGAAEKLVVSGQQQTWQPLTAGEQLDELTVIRTGFGAKVELRFADNSEVTVNNATKIGIGTFRTRGAAATTRLGLKYGTMRASVESRTGASDFQVATPVATLSVRGTGGNIGFSGDFGLGLVGTSGVWNAASGLQLQSVAAGEQTNSNLAQPGELALTQRNVRLTDVFGGVTDADREFLRKHGGGLGLAGFIGTHYGTPFIFPLTQGPVGISDNGHEEPPPGPYEEWNEPPYYYYDYDYPR